MSFKIIPLHHRALLPVEMPSIGLARLSLREWEVLLLLTEDRSIAEIADRLCMERKSVHNNKNRISRKLNLPGLGELNLFARTHRSGLTYWFDILVPRGDRFHDAEAGGKARGRMDFGESFSKRR